MIPPPRSNLYTNATPTPNAVKEEKSDPISSELFYPPPQQTPRRQSSSMQLPSNRANKISASVILESNDAMERINNGLKDSDPKVRIETIERAIAFANRFRAHGPAIAALEQSVSILTHENLTHFATRIITQCISFKDFKSARDALTKFDFMLSEAAKNNFNKQIFELTTSPN